MDRETFEVTSGGKTTAVKRYPISIEWPPAEALTRKPVAECRADVRSRNGLPPDQFVGIGVDRLDYTKGIIERFLAVERLFDLEPRLDRTSSASSRSRPPAAPRSKSTRSSRPASARWPTRSTTASPMASAPPILLKVEHHEPPEVYEHYRAADVCCVTSLHDGMNLVAKEFLASRDDERGVLILSQFTGASRELPEALIVNPYDIDQCAAALHLALGMPEGEQRDRMRIMRSLISEFNVYRWAGRMLLDAAGMRKRGKLRDARQ